ncbi:hypothetical protein RMCBS344292_11542 [Rhizopus microsporus]|nr:hypothetical protein RMCBS344292_11542 [Rhizopus microsporus]
MPPAKLASDFIPSISEGGVHQKLIKAEYVNNELLMDVDNNDQPKDNDMLNRLQVEFIVQENGSMKFNRAIGEKKRSVIDVLGLTSDIDVRFIARQFIDYSAEDLRQLFEKFKLLSYSEMVAPLHYKDMTLLDVSHINKKRYLYADDNLIYINRVQEQDKRTRRTEVELVSVDPVTLDTRNAVERWPSFLNNVSNLVYKWKL